MPNFFPISYSSCVELDISNLTCSNNGCEIPYRLLFECSELSPVEVHISVQVEELTIPPNSNITLSGYMDKQLPYHTTVAMVSITEGSIVPSDLDISPSLIQGVVSFEVCKNLSPCFSLYVFIIEVNMLVPKSIGTSIWYGLSGITKKTQGCVSSVDFKVNKGQMNNVLNSKHKIPPGLFGTPTETKVTLQDINTKALIDTGSTVSRVHNRSQYVGT
jgi:hypothetical protein